MKLPKRIKLEDALAQGFEIVCTDPPLYEVRYGDDRFIYLLEGKNILRYMNRIKLKEISNEINRKRSQDLE